MQRPQEEGETMASAPSAEAETTKVEPAPEEPAELINQSIMKATTVLTELARHRQGINVSDLARAVNLPRPTAFRILLTLERSGFVDRTGTNYILGWQMARIGRQADPSAGIVARVQPVLDDYAAKLNESLSFAVVRDALNYDVIAEASATRYLNASQLYIGRNYPLHASATGKILLAELDHDQLKAALPERLEACTPHTITTRTALLHELQQVKDNGHATIDDELEEGLYVIGCPVRNPAGELIGVITINGPTTRLRTSHLPATINKLVHAATATAEALATPRA